MKRKREREKEDKKWREGRGEGNREKREGGRKKAQSKEHFLWLPCKNMAFVVLEKCLK